jgi:hypothetical protein
VLDDDDVQLLQREQQHQPQDRHPGPREQLAQAQVLGEIGVDPDELPAQRHQKDQGDRNERQGATEERARHVEPDRDEDERECDPRACLPYQADRDRAVLLEPLQHAAQHRQDHPDHRRDRDRRGRPILVDVEQCGDQRSQRNRHNGHDDRESDEPNEPAPHPRAGVRIALGKVVADRPGSGHLQRRAGDHEDDERRDQHGQVAVARLAQHAGEDDREAQGQEVRHDHRRTELSGSAGV